MSSRIGRYIVFALVVIMAGALAGWYVFLRGERETIETQDLGRGAGAAAPFGIDVGSTYENIVSSFSSLVGGIVRSEEQGLPRLSQVGKSPAAGYGFVAREGALRLRFVERGSGYVFDIVPETGALERLTNTLIPRTYEALVAGDHIVLRGLEESGAPATIVGEIAVSTSSPKEPVALTQRRLVNGIRAIAIDHVGETLFYIVETPAGGSGIRSSWDGKSEKQIFSSAIAGWQIDMLDNGRIILTQNAEDGSPGHAFRVDRGSLEKIVGGVPGLTLLPHASLPAYLYAESAGGISLFAHTSPTSSPVALPVRTIADKCAWAPASPEASQGKALVAYCAVPQQLPPSDYLGRWYRGEMHTADAWWKIDVRTNSAEPLYASANASFDVEDPIVDPEGAYIAFRNAIDKTLWLLRIAE